MASVYSGHAIATKAVAHLINRISDQTPVADSLFERAAAWFIRQQQRDGRQLELEQQILLCEKRQAECSRGQQADIKRLLDDAHSQIETLQQQQQEDAATLTIWFRALVHDILTLCHGDNTEDTLNASARVLGTIQLLSPTEGKYIAEVNSRHRHLYKAVLSLRLLDQQLKDGQLQDSYILERYNASKAGPPSADNHYFSFYDDVQVPLVMASLLQDIGSVHPDGLAILTGADGKANPLRPLDNEQRTELLKVFFRECLSFAQKALVAARYMGRDRHERDCFVRNEEQKKAFLLKLLRFSFKSNEEIGSLLKIPQIYTAFVLSTKEQYQYEQLPKVGILLQKGVDKGMYHASSVTGLIKVTGHFPQGFGVVYVPKDSDGNDLERYEYAIVTGLCPKDPEQPVCRLVTYSMTFKMSVHGMVLSKANNLYYPEGRKKLATVSEERLLEILERLVSNFEERKNMPLLPQYWLPNDYFSVSRNQNLWNKVVNQHI
ncbi:hypothetical protein [Arsukibacterium sp.]|uniref:hypothetical protein n=1 Tax=Arsukibacterium sp. TaxID=1977258 RepID=UPI002FD9A3C7